MDAHPQGFQGLYGRAVIRPAVAIADNIGHAAGTDEIGDPRRPIGERPRIGDSPFAQRAHQVTAIDGNPGAAVARRLYRPLELAAKPAAGHLQKYKMTHRMRAHLTELTCL